MQVTNKNWEICIVSIVNAHYIWVKECSYQLVTKMSSVLHLQDTTTVWGI